MKLSTLIPFLEEIGATPQKKWSQNFLIDGNILRKIVQAAKLEPEDCVVEIGPGPGGLTETLLSSGARLIAIEKDPLFAAALKNKPNVEVFEADILPFPLEEVVLGRLEPGKKAKVIANLPYHITSPILKKLLPHETLFSSLTLMVQKEVALRITAKRGSPDYSHLSLFTHFFSNPSFCFTVSPSCFFPQPKVDSAVVRLELKQPPLPQEKWGAFFSLTRQAFQQRRKMVRASLKESYGQTCVLESLEECGLPSTTRPEELTLEEFLLFFRHVEDKRAKECSGKQQESDLAFHHDLELL